jgi:peroxiredoxin
MALLSQLVRWPRRLVRRWTGTQDSMTNIAAGGIAPGFSLKSLDGKEFSLGKLLERGPVVAAFFKISCPVCQFTFPFLERLYQRYGATDISFLGISQDNAADSKDFARQFGVSFPIVLDEKGYPVSNAYGLTNVPTIFLIEPGGSVKVSSMGFIKQDLETISKELADRRRTALAPLFSAGDNVPAFKAG